MAVCPIWRVEVAKGRRYLAEASRGYFDSTVRFRSSSFLLARATARECARELEAGPRRISIQT
jgi:hypothetical protein